MASKNKLTIAPGAMIGKECELIGEITIGSRTIIYPKARIIAETGPIIIGEANLIEEQVQILNVSNPPMTMLIGANNVFKVGAYVESLKIGDRNVLESKCKVGRHTEVTSACVIREKCELNSNEIIPKNSVVFGENRERRLQAELPVFELETDEK